MARSGAPSWDQNMPKTLEIQGLRENRRVRNTIASRYMFGSSLGRFGVPKGTQNESKMDPKLSPKSKRIMIEKLTAHASMQGFDGAHVRPRVPSGAVGGESLLDPKLHCPRFSMPMGHRPGEFPCFISFSQSSRHCMM